MAEAPQRGRKLSTFTKTGFRNSVFEEAAIIEGYLKKYSHGVFKRWQERYFTVQGHYLKYYTDENKIQKDLKGSIDLSELVLVERKPKAEVRVVLKDGESLLRCKTDEIADEWYDILKNYQPEGAVADPQAAEAPGAPPAPSSALENPAIARPIFITIKQATGLQGSSAKSKPDPLVIVTLLGDTVAKDDEDEDEDDEDASSASESDSDDEGGENRQHWQALTPVVKGTVSPEWNNRILLPAVTPNMMVMFTCIDWEGGSNTFLGQSCLRLQETGHFHRSEDIVLPLAEFENALCPRDGAGKPMEFEAVAANGGGELDIKIEPCDPDYTFACDVRATEDALSSASLHWDCRYVAVAQGTLHFYEEKGDPRPEFELDLTENGITIEQYQKVTEVITVTHPKRKVPLAFRFQTADAGWHAYASLMKAVGKEAEMVERTATVDLADAGSALQDKFQKNSHVGSAF